MSGRDVCAPTRQPISPKDIEEMINESVLLLQQQSPEEAAQRRPRLTDKPRSDARRTDGNAFGY
jgi:hypothetical protein